MPPCTKYLAKISTSRPWDISKIQHFHFQPFQLCDISGISQHLDDKLSRANVFIAQSSKPSNRVGCVISANRHLHSSTFRYRNITRSRWFVCPLTLGGSARVQICWRLVFAGGVWRPLWSKLSPIQRARNFLRAYFTDFVERWVESVFKWTLNVSFCFFAKEK